MTQYKYETHLHTAEVSRCAKHSAEEFVRFYNERGYTGIFITDHFFNGNTTVPPDLPWVQRVDLFCRGYEHAAAEGAKTGLDVFFGWEYSYDWAHLLTYGLDREWLLAHPDLLEWPVLDYLDRVHADGGFIVHAHPFREKIQILHLFPGRIDAVEVLNSGRSDDANRHALDYAESFRLPQTAGSDIHSTGMTRLSGVLSKRRFSSAADYPAAVIAGETEIFEDFAEKA